MIGWIAAAEIIDSYLNSLPDAPRKLAHAEWGITVSAETAGGWSLDIGLRIADELLRVMAFAVPSEKAPAAGQLLYWNRHTRLVRFAVSQSGDVWVQAEIPVGSVSEQQLDRLLGLVVEAAVAARTPVPEPSPGGGWLPSD